MNLKLNNERTEVLPENLDPVPYSSAEERRRNGRYISIVVGISLVCLAIYQAWIRQVPVLASLLIPALIMLLYIAWILYTASRDKNRALRLQATYRLEGVTTEQQQPTIPTTITATTTAAAVAATSPEGTVAASKPKDKKTKKEFTSSEKQFRRCYSIS